MARCPLAMLCHHGQVSLIHTLPPWPGVPEPCSATFVDNEGNETPDVTPLKINDNTFVFGAKISIAHWYKMVAVDAEGNTVQCRYMYGTSELTSANWMTSYSSGSIRYTVKNLTTCGSGTEGMIMLTQYSGRESCLHASTRVSCIAAVASSTWFLQQCLTLHTCPIRNNMNT